jgi:signal transduction histidine kinase
LLRAFGDELISSESVAVAELVKNAYDADAASVLVRFAGPLKAGAGSVEVIDDGHGMSLETIRTTWMEPGTLNRRRNTRSQERGRRVLGEKGIGRFAASRLAERLEVITRRTGAASEVHVTFDWSQFDDDDRFLDEVEARWWETAPGELTKSGSLAQLAKLRKQSPSRDRGTILRMTNLRTDWDAEKIRELRSTLARLVLPLPDAKELRADFEIFLGLPDSMADLEGAVETPEALGQPHYSIAGGIDADGGYKLKAVVRDEGGAERLSGQFRLSGDREPQCGPFRIELRVWDRDPSSMRELAQTHGQALQEIRRDLDEGAGVSIYRDGFRVLPYGEQQNDWLRLDLRRVQNPTMRVSNNQIVGYILVSADENPGLRDQTNREGLIEGPALWDLRDLVIQVLSELEKRRYKTRHPKAEEEPRRDGIFSGFDLADLQGLVRERHPSDQQLLAAVETKQRDLERRIDEVQEVLARYRRLATLGQLIDSVLHNGRTPLAKIRNEADLALREMGAKNGAQSGTDGLKKRIALVADQAGVLAAVFRRIEPFGGRKRGRPSKIRLEDVIANSFEVLRPELDRAGVNVDLPTTRTELTADPTELQEVLINLIDNSIYWLAQVPKAERRMNVDVRRFDDRLEVELSDSGPGVDPEYRDRIFEPYFSAKPEGVGLGLAIAGEIVQDYYGGSLELISGGALPGATFRATLRRRI